MGLFLEEAGAGLEEPPTALLDLVSRVLLAGLEVGEVGLAVRATDRLQVELDVVLKAGIEGLEEEGAELFASRAAKPMPPPNGPDRVFAAVPFLEDHGELAAEAIGVAEGLFDAGSLGVGEGIVEVGPEVLAGDLGHGGYCTTTVSLVSK
jgi:hypothetical protein